jgi:hypothetical protein
MKIFLNYTDCKIDLSPLSLIRHVADIRIGILTIREKWMRLLNQTATFVEKPDEETISIPANIIPTPEDFLSIIELAKLGNITQLFSTSKSIQFPWHIYQINDWAIRKDFELLTKNKQSAILPTNSVCICPENIFIEEGAVLSHSMLNASTGPIYISKNATLMEGCMIRGPFFLGENGVVKMGSKIYGATSIGKNAVVGGEIKNAVIFDNSNKAHDGYLGDSVIGSWCNIGAGTSNSNVKNNLSTVSYQTIESGAKIEAGNKAGLIMGDYSKCAINTAFNTGTIVGVGCNIFGQQASKTIPHFTWGAEKYDLQKLIKDIGNWMSAKNQNITEVDIQTITNLYQKENKQHA